MSNKKESKESNDNPTSGTPSASVSDTETGKSQDGEPKKAEEEELPLLVVAPGHSMTTLRGVLTEGDIVLPSYLSGGKATLKRLWELQRVVEPPPEPPKTAKPKKGAHA